MKSSGELGSILSVFFPDPETTPIIVKRKVKVEKVKVKCISISFTLSSASKSRLAAFSSGQVGDAITQMLSAFAAVASDIISAEKAIELLTAKKWTARLPDVFICFDTELSELQISGNLIAHSSAQVRPSKSWSSLFSLTASSGDVRERVFQKSRCPCGRWCSRRFGNVRCYNFAFCRVLPALRTLLARLF